MNLKLIFDSTKNTDLFYKIGIEVPDPFFFLDFGSRVLIFLDRRELAAFRRENKNNKIKALPLEPLIEKSKKIKDKTGSENKVIFQIFKDYKLFKKKVIVPRYFPLDIADFLRSKGVKLKVETCFYPERSVKSQKEKEIIGKNILIVRRAFLKIEKILKDSSIKGKFLEYQGKILTSEFLKQEAEKVLLENKMMSVQGMIVSCGAHSAEPHHRGKGKIMSQKTIICDIFPRNKDNGYFGDMTRTYFKGKASKEILNMHDAVIKARSAVFKKIKHNAEISEIHKEAVKVFQDKGYDIGEKGFIHGTGHGLGLDVHESPFISSSSKGKLKKGNVITIEPGLYYPKIGGVRIEDVIYVTENGYENLTNHSEKMVIN